MGVCELDKFAFLDWNQNFHHPVHKGEESVFENGLNFLN
jgi:hypothetical protein